jgi:hypothetical protein
MPTKKSAPEPRWPKRAPVTGIRLPSDLILEAKHKALDEGRTLRDLVELAIREYVRKGR